MAWNCTLYSGFKKRINSTKRPTGGVVYPCLMKHDTDFKNPTLEIEAADLSGVDYMQFNGQYFYVTGLVSHRTGIWEVTGRRDPMATFKEDIAAVDSMILYNQTGLDAGLAASRIPDERIPIIRNAVRESVASPFEGTFWTDTGTGSYILSAIGAANGVITYIVSQSAMAALVNTLNYDITQKFESYFNIGAQAQTTEQELADLKTGLWGTLTSQLAFGNYADCIKSCFWIPFSGFSGGVSKEIYLGDYATGVTGLVYGAKIAAQVHQLSIPWSARQDWKRNNQMVQLYLPYCGTIALPTDKLLNVDTVDVVVALDVVGANIAYKVTAGGRTLATTGANVGAAYAIGSSNVSMASFMQGATQAVGGGISAATGIAATIATGGVAGVAGATGGISSMIGGITQTITPQVQSVGSMGGIAAAGVAGSITLESLYFPTWGETDFQAAYGHPVMTVGKVGAGYNMCRGFSVECNGTPDEITQINSFFNNGAYYE